MSEVTYLPGMIVYSPFYGRPVQFFVRNVADTIQNHHVTGRFFELPELQAVHRHFPKGGVYLDVGANVGNHVLFVALAELTDKIIVIEPNPDAIALLQANLRLNELTFVDRSFLGVGLSDVEVQAELVKPPPNNLGEAFVRDNPKGQIRLVTGDSLCAGRAIDFIKIDVEGHEMRVLAGLEQVIAANRPVMLVEVDRANREAFDAWVGARRYEVAESFKPRVENENLLVRPVEKPVAGNLGTGV